MLFLLGWLVLAGYLLNEGNTFWGNAVLWGGLVLVICIAVAGNKEEKKKRADGQRTRETDRDEEEDYILYDCLFEDDDD